MGIKNKGNESGDEVSSNSKNDKKLHHRHSIEQIEQLELFFKNCPHPSANQQRELGKDLGLAPRQIKFWFQNKRTQIKTQKEREDNDDLRAENEKLYLENLTLKETLMNIFCPKCEVLPPGEDAKQQRLYRLRIENAWLKEERDRVASIVANFPRRPGTQYPNETIV